MLGTAVAFNLRGFAAEFHPWNRNARTIFEKLRVTGLVVLVTSIASLLLAGGCTLLVALGVLPPIRMVPTADADAARADHPARRAGRRRDPDGNGVPELLLRGEDHDGELRRHQRFHAGRSPARAVGRRGRVGLIPHYTLDTTLFPAMAIVIAGVFMILYGARRR